MGGNQITKLNQYIKNEDGRLVSECYGWKRPNNNLLFFHSDNIKFPDNCELHLCNYNGRDSMRNYTILSDDKARDYMKARETDQSLPSYIKPVKTWKRDYIVTVQSYPGFSTLYSQTNGIIPLKECANLEETIHWLVKESFWFGLPENRDMVTQYIIEDLQYGKHIKPEIQKTSSQEQTIDTSRIILPVYEERTPLHERIMPRISPEQIPDYIHSPEQFLHNTSSKH